MIEYCRACGSILPKYSRHRIEERQFSSKESPDRPSVPTARTSDVVKSQDLQQKSARDISKIMYTHSHNQRHPQWHLSGRNDSLQSIDKGHGSIQSCVCKLTFLDVLCPCTMAPERSPKVLVELIDQERSCQEHNAVIIGAQILACPSESLSRCGRKAGLLYSICKGASPV